MTAKKQAIDLAISKAYNDMKSAAEKEGIALLDGIFDNVATNTRQVVHKGMIVYNFMAISLSYVKYSCGTSMGQPPFGLYPDFPSWAKENTHYM